MCAFAITIDRKTRTERQRDTEAEKGERERKRKRQKEQCKRRRKETDREGERERERERDRETRMQKKFGACSTSFSGGNQVDGVPPVLSDETDQTARPMTKRLSVKYDNTFQFLMLI